MENRIRILINLAEKKLSIGPTDLFAKQRKFSMSGNKSYKNVNKNCCKTNLVAR